MIRKGSLFIFLLDDNNDNFNLCLLIAFRLARLFVPVIPGPPLSFVALLLLTFFTGYQFDEDFLWQWGTIVVGVTFVDFWLQVYGVKRFGGTKKAINGTMIGLLVGIFVPIPMGFIIGPFVGAFVGAYMDEKDDLLKVLKIASGALYWFYWRCCIKAGSLLVFVL